MALNAIIRSQDALVMLVIYILILTVLTSTGIYYIERGTFDSAQGLWLRTRPDGSFEISPYQSIIHACWWSVTTLTTTGYGDFVPVTLWGRVFAGFTMLCGLTVYFLL